MWRAVMISLIFAWMSGTTPQRICKYYDVVEYLNISSKRDLFLYTIPKKNWEEPLEIGLDFTLVSILSVKEKLQVVTLYFWLNVIWTNEFVSWDSSDFCNISRITLPGNLFWMPDIAIDERADDDKFTPSPYIYLSYNGSMFVFQVYRLTSSCNLDVHAFPFDEQKCNLTLISSIYSDKELILKSTKTSSKTNQDSRNNYLTNGEWKFEGLRIIQNVMSYDTGNSSTVTYEISMKRRAILYVLVLILPTFTLFLLDMAISFAIASPGEMIAFKVTLILEISVLSLLLNDMLPATSDDPPVIAMFFTGIFLFMVIGILENVFVAYLRENKSKVPFVKCRKFMNRFLTKKKLESESPVTNLEEEIPKKSKRPAEFPFPEKDNADSVVFLKHLNVELQEIKKHLALEGCQDAPEADAQDRSLIFMEKGLTCIRLVLSIIFLIYIIIKWTH
ncbi:5-hydroxytryptamine receptor 3A-like [Hemicordylus capensis]|uniref:5-hydroxytryptamine receptor 3A-like n=1 Tax=Hemicordylus capensis TaxID=884348 RepID=UPI00230337A5|nr:5-hydroxytryptamine receptor 3A-like [Hemicordylus capensis]